MIKKENPYTVYFITKATLFQPYFVRFFIFIVFLSHFLRHARSGKEESSQHPRKKTAEGYFIHRVRGGDGDLAELRVSEHEVDTADDVALLYGSRDPFGK